MYPANIFFQIMAIVVFIAGLISLGLGVFILVRQAVGNDLKVIAAQTAKMAQKGLAEDISGLVGNASALLNALNEMVRSATGIGAFLVFVSLALFVGAYFIAGQIH